MSLFPLLRFPFAVVGKVGKAVDTVLTARAVIRHGERFAAWAEPSEGLVEFEAEHEVLPGGFSWGDVAETYREALAEYCLRCGGSYTGEHTCLRDFPAGEDAVPPTVPPAGLNPPEERVTPDDASGEGPAVAASPQAATAGHPNLTAKHGLSEGFPFVQGYCPACGWKGLFIGSGGYVTCSQYDCPDPGMVSDLLLQKPTPK